MEREKAELVLIGHIINRGRVHGPQHSGERGDLDPADD
jgi:hypothetical protein